MVECSYTDILSLQLGNTLIVFSSKILTELRTEINMLLYNNVDLFMRIV